MTTKTKLSPLTLIIIAAVLLFVAAVVWKATHVDNSEEVYVPVIEKTKSSNKNKRVVIEDTFDIEHPEGSIEEQREKYSANMNKHIMFRSPEELMEVIIRFQEQGNDEKANEYIDFLLRRYPDYEMKQ
ncbi:hypothetical protein MNBD_GAMMA01-2174 [hydrothermal vent metagenome]|uniref:Uncharacterized protein n=1 Tax=hydrothermal vent metagenome TaxID=652676 RepID=A0A3B0UV99_9ZZZZ